MKKKKNYDLPNWVFFIIMFIGIFVPLVGPIIANIRQIQIHLETFGMYVGGLHIWNTWDWWYLTGLLYVVFGIIFWIKKK